MLDRKSVKGRTLDRRDFLKVGGGALAGASLFGLAGCGDRGGSSGKPELTFMTYDLPDKETYRTLIRDYEKQNPDVSINLEIVAGSTEVVEKVDTRLAAGQAPDIFRLTYQRLGRYMSAGALVDLTDTFGAGYTEDFQPAFRDAVDYEGKIYGLPHHTDTFALFYNADYFKKLNIDVPQRLEDCWSWTEFLDIARRLKNETEADYGFAMGWQDPGGASAYRWMPFLYMNGGQLLNEGLDTPEIDTPEGLETIAWTQSWFQEGLVPPNTAIKASTEIENLFATGLIGMMLYGDWMLPVVQERMTDYEWGVTYMPCATEKASDLGGNGLAVTKDSQYPDVAADFLKFLGSKENMRKFVTTSTFIPTRQSLLESNLDYALKPEAMNLFLEQATTIPQHMASVQTMPEFNDINQVLSDQLELAFVSEKSPQSTAQAITQGIEEALGG